MVAPNTLYDFREILTATPRTGVIRHCRPVLGTPHVWVYFNFPACNIEQIVALFTSVHLRIPLNCYSGQTGNFQMKTIYRAVYCLRQQFCHPIHHALLAHMYWTTAPSFLPQWFLAIQKAPKKPHIQRNFYLYHPIVQAHSLRTSNTIYLHRGRCEPLNILVQPRGMYP